jgi:predicted glycosyltransferase
MRALVEIVHPADVLFFLTPIRQLIARGDQVEIVSREKDVACDLLDEFALPHRTLSRAGSGLIGLASELVRRDLALLRHVRANRPDVMIGFGGVAISHVGRMCGIPAISFYAADTASLQTRLTWPFITHLYVPESYAGPVPRGRATRFAGVKELSYFHPDNFRSDPEIARENGWDPDRLNYFVRTVSWRANHDLGKSGWNDGTLKALIAKLAERGKVHLSSERQLPAELDRHRFGGAKNAIHHVLAHCQLYVGESATMAHEAAFLGIPAIYDGADHPGTTRELARHGLVSALQQPGREALLAEVDVLLDEGAATSIRHKLADYLAGRANLSDYIVAAIDRHGRKQLA